MMYALAFITVYYLVGYVLFYIVMDPKEDPNMGTPFSEFICITLWPIELTIALLLVIVNELKGRGDSE